MIKRFASLALTLLLAGFLLPFCSANAEAIENATVVCEIENGSYVIHIPAAENDHGWQASIANQKDGTAESVHQEMKDGFFVVRYDPVHDGINTVIVYHYTGIVRDQEFTWILNVQDGAVQESIGGSYTASPAEDELDPFISGDWAEQDTQFTRMYIAKNSTGGWDTEIISPMTHEAWVFRATVYFDCVENAFLYDNGALYCLTAEGEPAAEPEAVDLHGRIEPKESSGQSLLLLWTNEGSCEKDVTFDRVAESIQSIQ